MAPTAGPDRASTTCASSCARSAISMRASIASCSAAPARRRAAARVRAGSEPADRHAGRRAARAGRGDRPAVARAWPHHQRGRRRRRRRVSRRAVWRGGRRWSSAAGRRGSARGARRTTPGRTGRVAPGRRGALAAGLLVGLGLRSCTSRCGGVRRTGLEQRVDRMVGWPRSRVAAAISLLLGHAVAVTVLALLARRGLGAWLRPGLPLSSPKVTLAARRDRARRRGGAARRDGACDRDRVAAPPLTVVPTGAARASSSPSTASIVATLDRLRAAGRLPAFDRLLGQSVATIAVGRRPRSGARMDDDRDRVSRRNGTASARSSRVRSRASAAGCAPQSRILGGDRGRDRSCCGSRGRRSRRATSGSIPAFWEVAARAGLRTAVVHWWATWPAPGRLGIVAERSRDPAARARRRARRRNRAGRRSTTRCGRPGRRGATRAVGRAHALDVPRIFPRQSRPRSAARPSWTRRSSTSPSDRRIGAPICWWSTCPASTSPSTRCSDQPDAAGLAPSAASERVGVARALLRVSRRARRPSARDERGWKDASWCWSRSRAASRRRASGLLALSGEVGRNRSVAGGA